MENCQKHTLWYHETLQCLEKKLGLGAYSKSKVFFHLQVELCPLTLCFVRLILWVDLGVGTYARPRKSVSDSDFRGSILKPLAYGSDVTATVLTHLLQNLSDSLVSFFYFPLSLYGNKSFSLKTIKLLHRLTLTLLLFFEITENTSHDWKKGHLVGLLLW